MKNCWSKLKLKVRLYWQCLQLRKNRFVLWSWPGHFYSPLPFINDVKESPQERFGGQGTRQDLPAIDLRSNAQFELLRQLQHFYHELPFCESGESGTRYSFANHYFCHSDAIYLYGLLRYFKPQRLIEVGSGHSSAVILDTRERFLNNKPDCAFIEPYPERLESLLKPSDRSNCEILVQPVQKIELGVFRQLQADDILLIDSSHVSKFASDVNYLFFEVLPCLNPGVIIHVHDIFYPFEYPREWLLEGRAWNEAYLLRAFLMNNPDYEILLWSDYAGRAFTDELKASMPLCLKNTGSSIWLRKK